MMTTKQAAKKWGVGRRTVSTWINRGKIPGAKKIGRDWAIPADAERPADRRYTQKEGG